MTSITEKKEITPMKVYEIETFFHNKTKTRWYCIASLAKYLGYWDYTMKYPMTYMSVKMVKGEMSDDEEEYLEEKEIIACLGTGKYQNTIEKANANKLLNWIHRRNRIYQNKIKKKKQTINIYTNKK